MTQKLDSDLSLQTALDVIASGVLRAHYQPIVQLKDGKVVAHESLIRLPASSTLRSPDEFFKAARDERITVKAEQACLDEGVRSWVAHKPDTRLFLNLSAFAIIEMVDRVTVAGVMRALHAAATAPSALVIEITEHERVADLPRLVAIAAELRAAGLRFALDDFGDGRSSLRLWAELRPEFVKIDKYFIHDVSTEPVKVQTLRGLTRFAETFGTILVAEGIETEDELRVVRDLGIELGQGYFLGRPQAVPALSVLRPAGETIISAEIAVLPEITRAAGADFTVERLAVPVPALHPQMAIDEVAKRLAQEPALRAVALVEEGRPVGLINRQSFVDSYAKPYFKELYGRKPCVMFANTTPLVLDKHTSLEGMTAVLTSSDQRYLTEGFIVTEGGRYLGLGTGEQLVRVVTEVRIEAARHANPLTFLPGNIPISEHIDRLLKAGGEFVACYADLNDFKPYNDLYGYWRGDEMIRLVARTLVSHCDPRRDFVGHVGGDDFVVLFQSDDWLDRCERILASFNSNALSLFDPVALDRGGIEAEDRHGVMRFFKCTTLSLGAVPVRPGAFSRAEQVASAAAAAKHKAKASPRGLEVQSC
jgi:EAL domain-containing protein (putative c-di-GMP-specific phosphodiesterase class I)/GGDEF domain-containing protein